MLKRAVQPLIHPVDSIAHAFDRSQQLGRLFLHALLRGEDFGAVQPVGGKLNRYSVNPRSSRISAPQGFFLCSVHLPFNPPPDGPQGA